ncbi:MAG: methyltransferase domain-containing protein, partial [Deltaproteobacteria bacterium]|nr:methyltransferase domain-containing protein [Deltaproteobacteria bacterium]
MASFKEKIQLSFSDAAASYDKYAGLQKDIARKLTNSLKGKALGKVLDIGCGTGEVIKNLSKENTTELFGCDISHKMTQLTRCSTNTRSVCADFDNLPFVDSAFDTLVSSLA